MSKSPDMDFVLQYDDAPPPVAEKKPENHTLRTALFVAAGLLIVVASVLSMVRTGKQPKHLTTIIMPTLEESIHGSPPIGILADKPAMNTQRNTDNFCGGSEVLCSTSLTEKPAEALARLSSMLTHAKSSHYRVKVSVEAVK